MTSDYIYIFCIPGSDTSETRVPPGFSAVSESSAHSDRSRRAVALPRSSVPPSSNADNCPAPNSSRGTTTARVATCRPVGRPQSAVVDVPEDRAPLPARQRGCRTPSSSFRVSFPGAANNQRTSRQPDAAMCYQPSAQDSFQYELCTPPTYAVPHAGRAADSDRRSGVEQSEFYPIHWSPRATSSPVRERRRGGLCDARAKDCWRRVFNRECCLRCFVTVTTFRWLLLFFASVGAGCILSGVVLGVLYVSLGTSFLVLSVMFMGICTFDLLFFHCMVSHYLTVVA